MVNIPCREVKKGNCQLDNFSFLADDVRGSEQRRLRRPPPVNPGAPRLTKDDYFTVPDMKRLRRMRDDELKARHRAHYLNVLKNIALLFVTSKPRD